MGVGRLVGFCGAFDPSTSSGLRLSGWGCQRIRPGGDTPSPSLPLAGGEGFLAPQAIESDHAHEVGVAAKRKCRGCRVEPCPPEAKNPAPNVKRAAPSAKERPARALWCDPKAASKLLFRDPTGSAVSAACCQTDHDCAQSQHHPAGRIGGDTGCGEHGGGCSGCDKCCDDRFVHSDDPILF